MIKFVEKRSPGGSIDRNLSRICREAVELDKKEFSRRGKTQRDECNQASYSNINPINMLSSQKHLLTKKMQSIHDPKHTHIHTHTHTNKTSLTNFIFQK